MITLNLANSGVPVFSAAIDDRPGETVYLKWRLGDKELAELDEAAAAKFLRKTKPMDPIEAPLPNAPDNDHGVITLLCLARLRQDDGASSIDAGVVEPV